MNDMKTVVMQRSSLRQPFGFSWMIFKRCSGGLKHDGKGRGPLVNFY